jgi:cell wall-associated NlpC family hydrolase
MKLSTCLLAGVTCIIFSSCSSLNQLTQTKSTASVDLPTTIQHDAFIGISSNVSVANLLKTSEQAAPQKVSTDKAAIFTTMMDMASKSLETLLPMQFKYAIMLNTTVESIKNVILYKSIDEWFGTRYRMGGTSKKGIDCSAFMQVLALYGFGLMLPRTAKEQYSMMQPVDNDDLKEGDLVFFNTRGGVSHVGMYLKNNKFVHSCSSIGVSIGDLADKYWSVRFLGGRRMSGADVAFATH